MIYVEVYTENTNYKFSLNGLSFKDAIFSIVYSLSDKAIVYDTSTKCLAEVKKIDGQIVVEYLLDLFNAKKYFTEI